MVYNFIQSFASSFSQSSILKLVSSLARAKRLGLSNHPGLTHLWLRLSWPISPVHYPLSLVVPLIFPSGCHFILTMQHMSPSWHIFPPNVILLPALSLPRVTSSRAYTKSLFRALFCQEFHLLCNSFSHVYDWAWHHDGSGYILLWIVVSKLHSLMTRLVCYWTYWFFFYQKDLKSQQFSTRNKLFIRFLVKRVCAFNKTT